jgi:hypothetical protein
LLWSSIESSRRRLFVTGVASCNTLLVPDHIRPIGICVFVSLRPVWVVMDDLTMTQFTTSQVKIQQRLCHILLNLPDFIVVKKF